MGSFLYGPTSNELRSFPLTFSSSWKFPLGYRDYRKRARVLNTALSLVQVNTSGSSPHHSNRHNMFFPLFLRNMHLPFQIFPFRNPDFTDKFNVTQKLLAVSFTLISISTENFDGVRKLGRDRVQLMAFHFRQNSMFYFTSYFPQYFLHFAFFIRVCTGDSTFLHSTFNVCLCNI